MKKLTLITLVVLSLITFNSYAHKDHGAVFKEVNISQEHAIIIATSKVDEKIETNDIESYWSSVNSKTAVLERINGRQVWKVSLNQINGAVTDVLDVFVSKTGEFISLSE